jgi:hypothetical protein
MVDLWGDPERGHLGRRLTWLGATQTLVAPGAEPWSAVERDAAPGALAAALVTMLPWCRGSARMRPSPPTRPAWRPRYSPPSLLSALHDPFAVSTSDSDTSRYRHVTRTFSSELT